MPEQDQTRVGHCKRDEMDVYIGRGSGDRNLLNTQIGSRGWLGNPYPADVFGREECIQKFRSVFEERLHDEPEFREAVRELAGKTLGCWCQSVDEDEPACHGEVIAEHADRLAGEEVRTDGGTDVYRVRIWKGGTPPDEHHEGDPDEVVEVEEETPHVWQDDPRYTSPPLGIDVHPDDCPATLNVYTSESVRSPPGYESHVETSYWDGPMERGLDHHADHDYPPFGCSVYGRVMFFVEAEKEPEDGDDALDPRERCPKCDSPLVTESEDPLEEYCISPGCDYYRAAGGDGVIRE